MDTTVACGWTALPTGPIFLLATYDTHSFDTTCRTACCHHIPGSAVLGFLLLGGCEAISLTEQKWFQRLFQAHTSRLLAHPKDTKFP